MSANVRPGGILDGTGNPALKLARVHRYCVRWSNETAGSHVQARGWPDAGHIFTVVNLSAGTVSFERAAWDVG
jgi:hypothetical protein